MRTQMFGSILLAALVGCGGGGGGNNRPDAKIFLDAPIDAPAACAVMNSLGGLTLAGPDDAQGNPTPVAADWIDNPTDGPFAGRTVLSIGGRLPSSTAALLDVLIVDYVKPMAGNFVTNNPVNFDPNPNNVYEAASYVFGDADPNSNPLVVANFYYASNGSITLTQVGEAEGSLINGSVAATMYRDVDDQGADIPGGCTTSLDGLTFVLSQMTAQALQPPGEPAPGQLIPLTPDEWKRARAIINAKMANVRQ